MTTGRVVLIEPRLLQRNRCKYCSTSLRRVHPCLRAGPKTEQGWEHQPGRTRRPNQKAILAGIRGVLIDSSGIFTQGVPQVRQYLFHDTLAGKPNDAIDGKMWAKWYFWCDKCFAGIRCPLGTWRIPRTTPYILHGDEKALVAALPENLKLIPTSILFSLYLLIVRFRCLAF